MVEKAIKKTGKPLRLALPGGRQNRAVENIKKIPSVFYSFSTFLAHNPVRLSLCRQAGALSCLLVAAVAHQGIIADAGLCLPGFQAMLAVGPGNFFFHSSFI
jgi:hypothetical protein